MTTQSPSFARPKHTEYVRKHCMTCAAGWTRIREDGEAVIFCLLDREPVMMSMTSCDRYEARRQETETSSQESLLPSD